MGKGQPGEWGRDYDPRVLLWSVLILGFCWHLDELRRCVLRGAHIIFLVCLAGCWSEGGEFGAPGNVEDATWDADETTSKHPALASDQGESLRGVKRRSKAGLSIKRWLVSAGKLPCFWFWLVFSTIRIGEASHPGPSGEWSLGTFNPTGLTTKIDVVSRVKGDIWGITETHLSYEGYRKFCHGMRCQKTLYSHMVPGSHCQPRARSIEVGNFSGVMCLSKWPTRVLPHDLDSQWVNSSRAQVFGCCVQNLWVTLGVAYGFPHSSYHKHPRFQTEQLLEGLVDRVALQCSGPRVVMGDFNWQSHELTQLRRLESLGFKDLQQLASEWWGIKPKPTGRGDKIIDFVYISPEMFQLLQRVEVDDAQWPDHSAVSGVFRGGVESIRSLAWKIPQPISWPKGEWSFEMDTQHMILTEAYACCWHNIESQASVCLAQQTQQSLGHHQLGRGQTLESVSVVRQSAPIKTGRRGEDKPQFYGGSFRYAQRYRQLRRLNCLARVTARQHTLGMTCMEQWSLWKSIRHGAGYPGGFCMWWSRHAERGQFPPFLPFEPPHVDLVNHLLEVVRSDVKDLEKSLIKVRYMHSKQIRNKELAYVFKDCSRDAPEQVAVLASTIVGQVDFVEPDTGLVHFTSPVQWNPKLPVVIDGNPFVINSVKGNQVEVKEVIPEGLGGSARQTHIRSGVDDVLQAFHDEWAPRWQKSSQLEPSQWDQITAFVRQMFPVRQWDFPAWEVSRFRRLIQSKKSRAAVGSDGVSKQDLCSLPDNALSSLMQFYQRAETDAEWPVQLSTGVISSLEKKPGSLEVQGFRPIVVYPLLYRVWSTYRARSFLKQFAAFAPNGLRGGVPSRHAGSIWYEIAILLEHSHHHGLHRIGIVEDLVKAFNSIPRLPVFAMLDAMKVPQWLTRSWCSFVSSQQRRFRVRGSIGPPIPSSSGFPEGCALSVCAMALLDYALDLWLKSLDVPVTLYTFVDDWQLIHENIVTHQVVLDKLDAFVAAIQMDVDRSKSFTWAAQASDRHQLRQNELSVVRHSRTLGAHTNYTLQCGNRVLTQRLSDMKGMWKLFRASLSPFSKKCIALRMMAWPRAMHGIAVVQVGKLHYSTLRTNAVRGLRNDRIGTNPIAHLSSIGFTCDPEGWALAQTLKDARSFADEHYFRALMIEAVHLQQDIPSNGPVRILLDRIATIGWTVTCHGLLHDEVGSFDLFGVSIGELNMRLALSWPAVLARDLSHRGSFAGIQWADLGEVQRLASCFNLSDLVYLRCSWDGTMYTQQGKQHWVSENANKCRWCSQPHDFEHRMWQCPRFANSRALLPPHVLQRVDALSPCLRNHAWPVVSQSQVSFFQQLHSIPEIPSHDYIKTENFGRCSDLFVDGACLLPKDKVCRIAAFAVTAALTGASAYEHEILIAGHVPGILQSPFRAELWGLLHALQITERMTGHIRIWTDCAGVFSRAVLLQQGHSVVKSNHRHGDLWQRVSCLLDSLGRRVSLHKVVSHIDVGTGQSEVECWAYWHNGLVDAAASAMNNRRSDYFLQQWEQCKQDVGVAREVHLEIAKHAARVGKIANENRVVQPDVNPRLVRNEQKYGSKDNNVELPATMAVTSSFSRKFGADFADKLQQWWNNTGHCYLQKPGHLKWIAFTQLFCDFTLSTGVLGPWLISGKWGVPPSEVPLTKLPNFAQQCRWFQMALKQYWRENNLLLRSKLQRPSSATLACWMNSALVIWDTARLDMIDQLVREQMGGVVDRSISLEKMVVPVQDIGLRLAG